jgi:hypothetical protein
MFQTKPNLKLPVILASILVLLSVSLIYFFNIQDELNIKTAKNEIESVDNINALNIESRLKKLNLIATELININSLKFSQQKVVSNLNWKTKGVEINFDKAIIVDSPKNINQQDINLISQTMGKYEFTTTKDGFDAKPGGEVLMYYFDKSEKSIVTICVLTNKDNGVQLLCGIK